MASPAPVFFSSVEGQYIIWSSSNEETKEIVLQNENTDIKIIFIKWRLIYPVPNCPTPVVLENTVNITSTDNNGIEKLFKNYLIKEEQCFSFPNCKHYKFKLRFFQNESLIKNKISEEEQIYARYKYPRWGLRHECILI